ncbi:F-box/FBD/LRR-repeat protein at5g56420 [Phtheirospermum japonicum]|uniref:F-box/FBD/LRR-repeat protein at5g56420 n=1 Tax=Phtheirospermum japonicum TaxID=374723 RepID=A0A830CQA0_9LAMI|nr:F-box/FBD/LRR-repeat protein at5g56420 [Phtheirospermum japonicum]
MNTESVPSIDRLSAFPDDILLPILSFLPTKLSVSTSILAKRWRFLWAHVPNLHFDSGYHHDSPTRLPSIIPYVMSLHKVRNLHTFRLSYGYDEHLGDTWIATAMSRNVRVLGLRLRYALPQCLFTCETLVDLKLDRCEGIPSAGVHVSWPSLKRFHYKKTANF